MKSYCSSCNKETNHKLLREEPLSSHDADTEIWIENKYQIITCLGCDNISFREELICSEDIDPNSGDPYPIINLYPKGSKNDLTAKSIIGVPTKIRRIYRETIDCYNNESFTLCAAGLRAIIEGICAEEKITKGPVIVDSTTGKVANKSTLQGKIGGLYDKSILTKQHVDILHEYRFLGNDAVHELDIPSRETLKLAIEILELTFQNIYELKYKGEDLQWQRELRKNKTK